MRHSTHRRADRHGIWPYVEFMDLLSADEFSEISTNSRANMLRRADAAGG